MPNPPIPLEFESTHYAVIDFETTGGIPDQNQIIEIGCVYACGHDVLDTFSVLVKPDMPVHPFVWKLTGISPVDVDNAQPLEPYLDEFLAKIDGLPLFAHNASFDQSVLNAELRRHGREPLGATRKMPSWPWICTLQWARRLLPGLPRYKLSSLSEQLGLELHDAHRALADALATHRLVRELQYSALRNDWDLFQLYEALLKQEISTKTIAKLWQPDT